jgi:hypothetical protein
MSHAGTVAILALVAIVLRALCAHVVILPGVVVPVAGLVFMALVVIVLAMGWLMIRRTRRHHAWYAW